MKGTCKGLCLTLTFDSETYFKVAVHSLVTIPLFAQSKLDKGKKKPCSQKGLNTERSALTLTFTNIHWLGEL